MAHNEIILDLFLVGESRATVSMVFDEYDDALEYANENDLLVYSARAFIPEHEITEVLPD
jgi:hypothetical protein